MFNLKLRQADMKILKNIISTESAKHDEKLKLMGKKIDLLTNQQKKIKTPVSSKKHIKK